MAGVKFAVIMSLAWGPLVVAIGVVLLAGAVLGTIDKHYTLTEKLIEAIEKSAYAVENGFLDFINELE